MAFYVLNQAAVMYGATIGLLAIGFRLTHEASGYMNLGHNVNLGVGMMLGFIVIQQTGITPLLGAPFAFILTGGFNVVIYLLFYRRMETRKYSEALIALFGLVSVFLAKPILIVATYWLNLGFESEHWCRPGPISEYSFFLNHLHYRAPEIWGFKGGFLEVMLLFAAIVIASRWIYRKNMSLRIRAAAEDTSLLEICGINSKNVRALAWFIVGGLAGVAGIVSPYAIKGEFGRDVEILFVPVVLAGIVAENREPWIAGVAGLVVGFSQMVMVNEGQRVIGVFVGDYWNILDVVFLATILYMKDRRIRLPSWNRHS